MHGEERLALPNDLAILEMHCGDRAGDERAHLGFVDCFQAAGTILPLNQRALGDRHDVHRGSRRSGVCAGRAGALMQGNTSRGRDKNRAKSCDDIMDSIFDLAGGLSADPAPNIGFGSMIAAVDLTRCWTHRRSDARGRAELPADASGHPDDRDFCRIRRVTVHPRSGVAISRITERTRRFNAECVSRFFIACALG